MGDEVEGGNEAMSCAVSSAVGKAMKQVRGVLNGRSAKLEAICEIGGCSMQRVSTDVAQSYNVYAWWEECAVHSVQLTCTNMKPSHCEIAISSHITPALARKLSLTPARPPSPFMTSAATVDFVHCALIMTCSTLKETDTPSVE